MTTLKLEQPLIITGRLLPGVRIGEATVSLDPGIWTYYVDLDNGITVHGDDFRPGYMVGDSESEYVRSAMGVFLGFVSAYAESITYAGEDGELNDLFPQELAEWAIGNADDIAMTSIELEEE